MYKIAFVLNQFGNLAETERQLNIKGIKNVDVFPMGSKPKGYNEVIKDVEHNMSEAILIDCAGWIDEFGHPFERLSLVHKPQAKDKRKEGEAKLIKCIACTQELPDGLTITTTYDDSGVLITKTCPLCGALNDEVYTEYRNITELEIVPDPKQIETVKRSMVGAFVEEIRKKKGYKSGWTRFIAKDAVANPAFMDFLKELRNEHKLGLINLNTALTKLSKERKKYET